MRIPGPIHLSVLLAAGLLLQPAIADPAFWFEPDEIELVTDKYRIVVQAGPRYPYGPGTVEVASIGNPSQSRTAELPDEFDEILDVRVVSDKLWIHGIAIVAREPNGMMVIYRLEPLELLDWVQCETGQGLSPSGRFAIYEKGWKHGRPEGYYPVTLLYDLWAEPNQNRVEGRKAFTNETYPVSEAGRPIHPPDAAAARVYRADATATTPEEKREAKGTGTSGTGSFAWSDDEHLVAFKLAQNMGAEDRSLERVSIVVIELDSEGRPVKYHEVEVPETAGGRIEFLGSSIRMVRKTPRAKVIWRMPDPQPWQQ